jgi:hypothetical protein
VQGANFQNCSLYGAKCQGIEAQGADFRSADLRNVNFGGAYLEGAMLPAAAKDDPKPPSPSEIADQAEEVGRAQQNGHDRKQHHHQQRGRGR